MAANFPAPDQEMMGRLAQRFSEHLRPAEREALEKQANQARRGKSKVPASSKNPLPSPKVPAPRRVWSVARVAIAASISLLVFSGAFIVGALTSDDIRRDQLVTMLDAETALSIDSWSSARAWYDGRDWNRIQSFVGRWLSEEAGHPVGNSPGQPRDTPIAASGTASNSRNAIASESHKKTQIPTPPRPVGARDTSTTSIASPATRSPVRPSDRASSVNNEGEHASTMEMDVQGSREEVAKYDSAPPEVAPKETGEASDGTNLETPISAQSSPVINESERASSKKTTAEELGAEEAEYDPVPPEVQRNETAEIGSMSPKTPIVTSASSAPGRPSGNFDQRINAIVDKLKAKRDAPESAPRSAHDQSIMPTTKLPDDIAPSLPIFVVRKNANLRERPTTKSKKIGLARANTHVHVIAKVPDAEWYRVNHPTYGIAYIWAPLLIPAGNTVENTPAVNDGFAAYREGDYDTALKIIRPLAKRGEGQAAYLLAAMYSRGQGLKQDRKEAIRWLRKAATSGLAAAQVQLGIAYYYGSGVVRQNYGEAIKWFKSAAAKGHQSAQSMLGVVYYLGNGVSKDYVESAKWFQKASEEEPLAQTSLGLMYYLGRGVEQDYAKAVQLLRKAAKKNIPEAQRLLARAYFHGNGVKKDLAEAAKWYRIAANQGNVEAQRQLGFMFLNGSGVTKSYVFAYMWLAAAISVLEPGDLRDEALDGLKIAAKGMTAREVAGAKKMAEERKRLIQGSECPPGYVEDMSSSNCAPN